MIVPAGTFSKDVRKVSSLAGLNCAALVLFSVWVFGTAARADYLDTITQPADISMGMSWVETEKAYDDSTFIAIKTMKGKCSGRLDVISVTHTQPHFGVGIYGVNIKAYCNEAEK